jgi:hypothetical protein
VDIRARPTAGSLTQASRSRKSLYRAAYSAYRELQLVEQGREETLRRILGESLLGPVEKWRRFELLLALRMAEALSYAIQRELILNPIETAGKGPLASCGRFDIYWQNQTTYYKRPDPEPSEQRVERLLGAYRVRAGGDRPDVIVVDRDMERPVAIAEAKYVSGEFSTWENAMREAAAQVVRYSRGFVDSISQDELLRNSILAISTISQETTAITPQNEPVAFNQYQLLQGDLSRWTSRIIQH